MRREEALLANARRAGRLPQSRGRGRGRVRGRGRSQRSILHEKRRKTLVSEGSSLCILAGYAGKGWSLRLRGFVSGTGFLTDNELVDSAFA
jgi:hypothetical protein